MSEFSFDLWPPSLLNRRFRPSAEVAHQGHESTEVPKTLQGWCQTSLPPRPSSPLQTASSPPGVEEGEGASRPLHIPLSARREFISISGTTQKQNARLRLTNQPRDLWSWSSVSLTFGGRCWEKVTWTRSEPPALPSVVGAGSGRRATDVLQGACPQLCHQATTPPSIVVIRMYNSNNMHNANVNIMINELQWVVQTRLFRSRVVKISRFYFVEVFTSLILPDGSTDVRCKDRNIYM